MFSASDLNFMVNNVSGVARQVPMAWLRITGPDAAVFLQGQCTQDLRGLEAGRTAWALWLSIKGKVLGESLILRETAADGGQDVWWLWSAHTTGEALRARLEEFIIADDVTVEDCGAAGIWEQVTLAGREAAEWLGGAPAAEAWTPGCGGYLFAGRRGPPPPTRRPRRPGA